VNLSDRQPIFVGLKLDGQLKRRLASITGPDRKYVSADDPTFLLHCRLGEDEYVGKLVQERLTTDRVDDVRRNVLSILQRLCPDTRLPAQLEILAVEVPAAPPGREGARTDPSVESSGDW
jgi:hypothetical protein